MIQGLGLGSQQRRGAARCICDNCPDLRRS
nr:MAG TPA: hypothetical protein [Caudoviricetes sp.]